MSTLKEHHELLNIVVTNWDYPNLEIVKIDIAKNSLAIAVKENERTGYRIIFLFTISEKKEILLDVEEMIKKSFYDAEDVKHNFHPDKLVKAFWLIY